MSVLRDLFLRENEQNYATVFICGVKDPSLSLFEHKKLGEISPESVIGETKFALNLGYCKYVMTEQMLH